MRNAAVWQLEQALPLYIIDAGQLTDELQSSSTGASTGQQILNGGMIADPLDERILPENRLVTVVSYTQLQAIRTLGNQAIGALAAYDTVPLLRDSGTVLRGELYAFEGYAEVLLADLFCSGVPLSTFDFQRDFTYRPSSNTTQVYMDALAKLDTAFTLAGSNDSLANFVRVMQGRVNLDLGKYTAAADDVTTVPDSFVYQVQLQWNSGGSYANGTNNFLNTTATVSDREGGNGLPYRSGGDPRTAVIVTCVPAGTRPLCVDTLTFPAKDSVALSGTGFAPLTLASGTEARLIQAEEALNTGQVSTMLTILNALRAASDIPPLTDPGAGLTGSAATMARIQLLFQERAYWFFADGHRQGDLRRLMRQYGAQIPLLGNDQHVYPSGTYFAPGTGRYGSDVTAPIPASEDANPYFHGCLNRNP